MLAMKHSYVFVFSLTLCLLFGTAAGVPSAEEQYQAGVENMKQEKFLDAIGHFTEAVSMNPKYADAYYQRAKAKEALAKQKGYFDTEHYVDLLQAMHLGKQEALKEMKEGYSGECISGLSYTGKPTEVYCMDISAAGLTQVPAQLQSFPNLIQLSVADNNLTDIEAITTKNQSILFLDAHGNNLKSLSMSIKNLIFLQELNLRDNNLSSLPAEITELKHLQILTLTGNPISPAELEKIHKMLPSCKIYLDTTEPIVNTRGNIKFRKSTDSQANKKSPSRF